MTRSIVRALSSTCETGKLPCSRLKGPLLRIVRHHTNAVLHLLAIADAASVKLTIDDFQSVSDRIPFLADLKPSGKYVMADLHAMGGTHALLKYLLKEGLRDGSGVTITGKTIRRTSRTLVTSLATRTLFAPLATTLSLPATSRSYVALSPLAAPPARLLVRRASTLRDVALLTDGRYSGGSYGFIIGYIVPKALDGGPIALVHNSDHIVIDAEKRVIDLEVAEDEMAARRKAWKAPPPRYTRGTLTKYARLVTDASSGCMTDKAQ
ncbi:hypothetical protein MY5147_009949 [Beauveria neobassiana]